MSKKFQAHFLYQIVNSFGNELGDHPSCNLQIVIYRPFFLGHKKALALNFTFIKRQKGTFLYMPFWPRDCSDNFIGTKIGAQSLWEALDSLRSGIMQLQGVIMSCFVIRSMCDMLRTLLLAAALYPLFSQQSFYILGCGIYMRIIPPLLAIKSRKKILGPYDMPQILRKYYNFCRIFVKTSGALEKYSGQVGVLSLHFF